jgi:hypothetical protein
MSRWRSFLRRSWHERALFLEAWAWLIWSRGLILCLPFRAYAKRLGQPQTESSPTLSDEQQRIVRQVKWAVQTAVRYSPVRFVCLPQAMAAKWMLRRRRVAPRSIWASSRAAALRCRPMRGCARASAW